MIDLIDSHSHLDAPEFDADRDAVIERARAAGVRAQIIPAIDTAGWPALRELCATTDGLHPAYGLHPLFLARHTPTHLADLRTWLQQEREQVVAVGECGLDFWVEDLDRTTQQDYFIAQLKLAREFELPVIVHARKALDEVTATLRRVGGLRGVVHSFSGSLAQAEALWKLGIHLGIGGPVTYPRASRLRGIVADMPADYLLLETDSPDQPLHGQQGRRNEPARLADVLVTVAELRGESCEFVATLTRQNTATLFRIELSG